MDFKRSREPPTSKVFLNLKPQSDLKMSTIMICVMFLTTCPYLWGVRHVIRPDEDTAKGKRGERRILMQGLYYLVLRYHHQGFSYCQEVFWDSKGGRRQKAFPRQQGCQVMCDTTREKLIHIQWLLLTSARGCMFMAKEMLPSLLPHIDLHDFLDSHKTSLQHLKHWLLII